MIIDTDAQTVTFKAGETVSLEKIWELLALLEPWSVTQGIEDPEAGWLDVKPKRIYPTRSDTKSYYYAVVEFEDGAWACSCLDWVHRKAETNDACKHIARHTFWR